MLGTKLGELRLTTVKQQLAAAAVLVLCPPAGVYGAVQYAGSIAHLTGVPLMHVCMFLPFFDVIPTFGTRIIVWLCSAHI